MMTNIMDVRSCYCNWTLREIECQAPKARDFNLGGQLCEKQYRSKALPSNATPAVVWWYGLLVLLQNWTLIVSVGSAGSGEQVRRCDDDLDGLSRISQDQDGLLSQDSQDGLLSQDSQDGLLS